MDERPTILPDGDWSWPNADQPQLANEPLQGSYDAWTKPAGPTDLTLEMPIPDYARPPEGLAWVLRDHFDGVKQEFSAKLGQGIRRQLDEADHDPNNPLQRGTFKLTDHEKMLRSILTMNEEIILEKAYLRLREGGVLNTHQQHLAGAGRPRFDLKKPFVLLKHNLALQDGRIHYLAEDIREMAEKQAQRGWQLDDTVATDPVGDHRTNYLQTALDRVREVVDAMHPLDPKPEYNLYVVWFCKTLQNWKALVGSTLADGMYYEVTYDGDKGRTYVDIYHKVDQSVIYDDPSC